MRRLLLVGLLLVSGCASEPRFDASSKAAAERSLKTIGEGLSQEEKETFAKSVMAVVFRDNLATMFQAGMKGEKFSEEELYKPLHGLTVKQINAKAAEVRSKK